MKKFFILLIIFAIATCALVVVAQQKKSPLHARPMGAQFTDATQFLSAIKQSHFTAATTTTTGIIVPHHLLAIDVMASAYGTISLCDYTSIIILSPDHFDAAQRDVAVSVRDFDTIFGVLKNNDTVAKNLQALPFVSTGDFFYREHGIGSQLPFIKYYFPTATVLAITIKPQTSIDELNKVIGVLKKYISKKSLVIESTDFSHYLLVSDATIKDSQSIGAIKTEDASAILKLHQPNNVDSVAALYIQTVLQQDFFHSHPEILQHKNSQEYTSTTVTSTTSYISAIYKK